MLHYILHSQFVELSTLIFRRYLRALVPCSPLFWWFCSLLHTFGFSTQSEN